MVRSRDEMEAAAKVTSKGQVTVPKAVRDALGIHEGDRILFRFEDDVVVVTRTPDFLDLAGTIPVPDEAKGASWSKVRRESRARRAAARG